MSFLSYADATGRQPPTLGPDQLLLWTEDGAETVVEIEPREPGWWSRYQIESVAEKWVEAHWSDWDYPEGVTVYALHRGTESIISVTAEPSTVFLSRTVAP